MKILVSGCYGFIGYNLCIYLCHNTKYKIYGIDNLNSISSANELKNKKKNLNRYKNFYFNKIDICNLSKLFFFFKKEKFQIVINLAAKAGVRDSFFETRKYFQNNILGFFNMLDLSKKTKVKHFLYASSSSVYNNKKLINTVENLKTENQISMYAATKKNNEVLAHSYSAMFKIPTTGLRFFTVYGPFGRTDMAVSIFTNNIIRKKLNFLFNRGNNKRDFTFIDDVVKVIHQLARKPSKQNIPYQVFNIGTGKNVSTNNLIKIISKKLNLKPKIKYIAANNSDVKITKANTNKLFSKIGFIPSINLDKGLEKYINWLSANEK